MSEWSFDCWQSGLVVNNLVRGLVHRTLPIDWLTGWPCFLYLKLIPKFQGTWWKPLVSLWAEGTAAVLALWFFFLNFVNKMPFVSRQTMRVLLINFRSACQWKHWPCPQFWLPECVHVGTSIMAWGKVSGPGPQMGHIYSDAFKNPLFAWSLHFMTGERGWWDGIVGWDWSLGYEEEALVWTHCLASKSKVSILWFSSECGWDTFNFITYMKKVKDELSPGWIIHLGLKDWRHTSAS